MCSVQNVLKTMTQSLESGEHAALQVPDDSHRPFAIAASQGCELDVICSFLSNSQQVPQH
jgi:hypothetical protein